LPITEFLQQGKLQCKALLWSYEQHFLHKLFTHKVAYMAR